MKTPHCQDLGLSHDFFYDYGINEFICRRCGHVLTKEDKQKSLEYANALRRLEEEDDDGYPCYGHNCYDRGNYHTSCAGCSLHKHYKE